MGFCGECRRANERCCKHVQEDEEEAEDLELSREAVQICLARWKGMAGMDDVDTLLGEESEDPGDLRTGAGA